MSKKWEDMDYREKIEFMRQEIPREPQINATHQIKIPSGDEQALREAIDKLTAAIPKINTEQSTRSEPLRFTIQWVPIGADTTLVYMDCTGYTGGEMLGRHVARGRDCCWEPLLESPVYERSGPETPHMLFGDEYVPRTHQTYRERLADGFRMMGMGKGR